MSQYYEGIPTKSELNAVAFYGYVRECSGIYGKTTIESKWYVMAHYVDDKVTLIDYDTVISADNVTHWAYINPPLVVPE